MESINIVGKFEVGRI